MAQSITSQSASVLTRGLAHGLTRDLIRVLVRSGASGLALAGALAGAPVLAQTAEGPAAAGSASGDIIVTAQRRSERLESVPMSVSAVSPERIRAAGITNVRDLSGVVPGFQLAASGVFPQPAIRGISAAVSNFFDNNVAVYVDGLYQASPLILNLDLPNVAGIEVLKGPQGTLYGRNATGGAVLLNTLDPTQDLHLKAELSYGRFGDMRASGYVSGGLSDRVSLGLAGNIRHSEGYYKYASRTTPGALAGNAAPIDQTGLRAKLKVLVTDDLTATLTASNTYISDTRTNVYTPLENVSARLALIPAYATTPTVPQVYAADPGNAGVSKQTEFGLKLSLHTGIGSLQSISGYTVTTSRSLSDFDGTYAPGTYLALDPVKNYTFQQALDYSIDAIKDLNLVIGAMYVDAILSGQQGIYGGNTANPGTAPLSLATDYSLLQTTAWRNHKKAWAGYIDATWNVTDHVYLNLGGRYSSEELSADGYSNSALASLVRIPVSTGKTFNKFTPRASIRYEFDPRTSIYASYSQGFRSGNYNNAMPACVNTTNGACFTPARQEEVDAFEVGFKTARSHVRFDASGFYYNYRGLQITAVKQVDGLVLTDLSNAPKARIYGAEANLTLQPVENLTITAGATWLHARYGDGFIFQGTGVSNATAGLNSNPDPLRTYPNLAAGNQDLSGLMMTRSPNFSGNVGIAYHIPQGEGGWDLAANTRFTTRYIPNNPSVWGANPGVPASRQNEQRFVQNGYAIVNASVTWTNPDGHYFVSVWGRNLTDKQFILNVNASTYGTYFAWSDPVTYGATLGFKF